MENESWLRSHTSHDWRALQTDSREMEESGD
jgi:hypothetical protein